MPESWRVRSIERRGDGRGKPAPEWKTHQSDIRTYAMAERIKAHLIALGVRNVSIWKEDGS
jgi:hypothetical protein